MNNSDIKMDQHSCYERRFVNTGPSMLILTCSRPGRILFRGNRSADCADWLAPPGLGREWGLQSQSKT